MSIILISGGQRSGKSSFAQQLAEAQSEHPVYLATARHWDEDFSLRIKRHQADRDSQWITLEEEKHLGKHNLEGQTVVLDCITLWLTNIFHDNSYDAETSLQVAKNEWEQFIKKNMDLIVVTNELGMSIHAQDEASRKFTDLQGRMNQHIAKTANRVVLMVAGIPLTIKQ